MEGGLRFGKQVMVSFFWIDEQKQGWSSLKGRKPLKALPSQEPPKKYLFTK
jgi:hypothetical protein